MHDDIKTALNFIFSSVIPLRYERPAAWAEHNIKFTRADDPLPGAINFDFSPFLRDVVNAWELKKGQGLKEITVVAPEQTGKTLSWLVGLAHSLDYRSGLALIYYTSDDKAEKVNEKKLEPVLDNIPRYSELMKLPYAHTKDVYRLGTSSIYFAGVGSRVSSFTARTVIADEIDDWNEPKGVNSLYDLRKRTRAYTEAVLCKVCTPKGTDKQSKIWREFMDSSRGYYYLRCEQCSALTMRSCDIHNLQWELDEAGAVVDASIRLICPKCGYQHRENQKEKMIRTGGFIHQIPERINSKPGFQWGGLASFFIDFRWIKIADLQLRAGKSGSLEAQIFFDNSVKGRPFKIRKLDEKSDAALKRHAAPIPEQEQIKIAFMSVDTQNDCFFWIVRGLDTSANTYLLACGRAADVSELEIVWNARYAGRTPTCGIIDEGGQRVGEVRDFILTHRGGLFSYKGNPRISVNYKESEEVKHLLLANPRVYHLRLLYMIYAAVNHGKNFWFLPEELNQDYREQLCSWKENPLIRNGNDLENYTTNGNDHYFDCEKMMLVLIEYYHQKIIPILVAAKKKMHN